LNKCIPALQIAAIEQADGFFIFSVTSRGLLGGLSKNTKGQIQRNNGEQYFFPG
jgi:putative protein kinase ArgK-like GTPase of G3E family